MSDLEKQLDGLIGELGVSGVRKLAKAFNKNSDNPLLQSLVMDYGEEEVRSALNKLDGDFQDGAATVRRAEAKVGRNDPCPCGSGKKHKKCCG